MRRGLQQTEILMNLKFRLDGMIKRGRNDNLGSSVRVSPEEYIRIVTDTKPGKDAFCAH